MSGLRSRIHGGREPPDLVICDAWLADDVRVGEADPQLGDVDVLGRWPSALDADAVVRLAEVVGLAPCWSALVCTPPVAQKLAERARLQPLDVEIARHLPHLQHVCHRPRLHLRVEEERLPVSRARRVPVRAVADLVSHPGDWEHRSLRSIHPARVLSRQVEDEWDLYENRVAVRLVDHLLEYLARRLEELRRIKEILDGSRDYSEEMRATSYRRARRIAALWAETLESKPEGELGRTMKRLELAQRSLQHLLDAPLYRAIPRRRSVPTALKQTNILVNDAQYRKVAALWRAWVRHGRRRQETMQQRALRRLRQAQAWDQYVLHLVARTFADLGWVAHEESSRTWSLSRRGWRPVRVQVDDLGVVRLSSHRCLALVPLCADLSATDAAQLAACVRGMDGADTAVVLVHVGVRAPLPDLDRATGWGFGGQTALLGCSPWDIDSEERMARVVHGWLARAATPAYPRARQIPALPETPGWRWLHRSDPHMVATRAPDPREAAAARAWGVAAGRELQVAARWAKKARQASPVAPRRAVRAFADFVDAAVSELHGMDECPVCGGAGAVEVRLGTRPDAADTTWWARCEDCASEWGLRACGSCGGSYRALAAQVGLDRGAASAAADSAWPDRVLGRDVWAQPCRTAALGDAFRCTECGVCSEGGCRRCLRP